MKIKYILSILAVILFSGCDFLNEHTQDKFKPSTTEDFDAILVVEGYSNQITNPIGYYDFLTDDVSTFRYSLDDKNLIYSHDRLSVTNSTPFYTWNPEMYQLAVTNNVANCNSWEVLYKLIMPCNVVLGHIDQSIGTVEAKGFLKAQALFLRAYYHYYLINLYSDPYNSGDPTKMRGVPYISDFKVSDNFPKPHSVEEVFEFMLKDLHEAIDLFEAHTPELDVPVQRASLYSAHGLVSRIYMHMDNNWDKVIEHSKEILDHKNELDILEQFIDADKKKIDSDYRPYSTNNNVPKEYLFGCFSGKSSAYIEDFFTGGNSSKPQATRPFAPSKELMDLYIIDLDYSDTDGGISKINSGDLRYIHYYSHRKTGLKGVIPSDSYTPNYGIKTNSDQGRNFTGMRTAEIYLNMAEALIRRGNTSDISDAYDLLNTLRKSRWYGTYNSEIAPTDKDLALAFCLEERRRELSFEHIRWFDLRRLGRPRLVHKMSHTGDDDVVLEDGDKRYTLPIPKVVTDRNPELLLF